MPEPKTSNIVLRMSRVRGRSSSFLLLAAAFCFALVGSSVFAFTATSTKLRYSRTNLKTGPLAKRLMDTRQFLSATTADSTSSLSSSSSTAAQWHRDRRQQMLAKYGDQIAPLERTADCQSLGGGLLAAVNITLGLLAVLCGRMANWKITLALALFPGSTLSLWQLQILHDNLHGSLLNKGTQKFLGGNIPKKRLQKFILFFGSMPSIFGYYLYLQYGHLTHHQAVGDPASGNLRKLFDSSKSNFEDGDVLFVAHRMKLLGEIGPRFVIKGKEIVMSISNLGFSQWKTGKAIWNMGCFATSFLYERILLCFNDVVVALMGRNFFFLNKPNQFHRECAQYCRVALLVRGLIWWLGGRAWQSLLFLYLAETLWSIPPHPCSAMFVTNHGSRPNLDDGGIESSARDACIPSSSTYAGKWYSLLTLGTNYHCEHHDFPTIPLHRLGELREIAPEFYRRGSNDRLWPILVQAFAYPDYYACMNDMNSVK